MPVVCDVRCLFETVQNIVEVPQLQYFDKVVDDPVVQVVGGAVQFLDKVDDMPVGVQRLVFVVTLWKFDTCSSSVRFGRPCGHAATKFRASEVYGGCGISAVLAFRGFFCCPR